ncbi:hypothetical protein [Flavobacterium sp. DSR3-2]|uniref:hypothetical protein n=1 Tax=Flavobacterium sp. DSR3-2 TaxID=2804634 RepID=UPI003CEFBF6D
MDYKSTYDNSYHKTYNEVQNNVEETLIRFKTETRTFNFALNAIIKNNQELINISDITSNKSLSLLEVTYKKSLSCYSENAIELTLKNDVFPEYLKLNEDELPPNYSFQSFVFDLASLHALKEISRLFNYHSKLFEKMFELNDFTDFVITTYGNLALEDTPTFKKLYPQENQIQSAETILFNLNNESKIETKNKMDKAKEILLFNISKFSEDEKIFLLHAYYNSPIKISLPEYSKLMLITNNITDLSIFTLGSNNNRFYDKIYKGVDYYGVSEKRVFINAIIIKLEPFGLSNINKIINLIKSKIN